jgi:hypothetical protein
MREAGYRNVEVLHITYDDLDDGSAQALKRFPEALLSEQRIMNTSLLSRIPELERKAAFDSIRRDHASGRLAEVVAQYEPLSLRAGDGTMFVGRK